MKKIAVNLFSMRGENRADAAKDKTYCGRAFCRSTGTSSGFVRTDILRSTNSEPADCYKSAESTCWSSDSTCPSERAESCLEPRP